MNYAELAITTNYSFLRGASSPEEFAITATKYEMAAIGIADRNTLAGVVRAYAALKHPDLPRIKPKLIVGSRLVFRDGTPDILVYPTDREAYGRLCRLLSIGKLRAKKGDCLLDFSDLADWQEGQLFIVAPSRTSNEIRSVLSDLTQFAPNRVWLAASMPYHGIDKRRLHALQKIANMSRVPLIATNDPLYHDLERRELQDVITCIREGLTLSKAGKLLEANAERHLKPPEEMIWLFKDYAQAINETIAFANRVDFTLKDIEYNYPDEPIPKGKTPEQHLEDLTWEGAQNRYPNGVPDKVREILHKELKLITKRKYARYFLTVRDIVQFANEEKILCQGRGSAANSAVCYVLGITAVDPLQIDLLFERFVSQEREEPPDIDVDFEHERREEVIQYIYKRYGYHRAAIAATVICYRPRSAIREVGKVFGLTEDVTASLASGVWGSWGSMLKEHEILQGNLDPQNLTIARAVMLANQLIGFPRHLSQHVGGFVLTRDRLDEIVPIGPAAMDDRYFIEWDKDDIDRLGMMKVDVLALGMLTCIRKAFDLFKLYDRSLPDDLATVPREDHLVYDMLCEADAIGVFQVESRAQMNMLPRLKPRKFYDLVIEVAIVRPGPIQGDMVHPYLRRRDGKETVDYPAPSPLFGPADELKQVLGKTMGVPLFQEQAMKLAIVAAEFSAEEANGLRRAMATFRHVGTINRFREKMVGGMTRRGYDPAFAERCFKQIEGFGSYGFPESHAASFSHLVYISAWIKRHHPAAFACALLNAQPMGFYAPAEIVRDAREHGVEVLAPDINFSHWDNTLECDDREAPALRLGFRQIDGFSEVMATKLVQARVNNFSSVEDIVRQTELPKRALIVLAEADTFRSIGIDRREALWAVRRLNDTKPLPLFAASHASEQAKEDRETLPLMPLSEHVLADYQMLRLSLKAYPMQFLRERYAGEKILSCKDAANAKDGTFVRAAGIVLVRQRPGEGKAVFITLSDETGILNAVVWIPTFKRYRKEVMGARVLLIEGRIQRSENVVHLMAERMTDRTDDLRLLSEESPKAPAITEPYVPRHPRNVRVLPKSRDFH